MRPYLVGFYLAMNQFRPGRSADGWKVGVSLDAQDQELSDDLDALVQQSQYDKTIDDSPDLDCHFLLTQDTDRDDLAPPDNVPRTDLLMRNVRSLKRLVTGDTPLQLLVRPISGKTNVVYEGSDASGEGFGTLDWFADKQGEYVFGYWNRNTANSSSNWRPYWTRFAET